MATFQGGMREQADHRSPLVRLTVDADEVRFGPALGLMRRYIPTYVIPWELVERIEPVLDRYQSGAGVRFVLRAPLEALEGSPAAARWPAARQPMFLCGSTERMNAVLRAVPAELIVPPPAPLAPA